jgi:endogenous inhibitor of DNA gyrase (YacG/DUF329 family)
MTYIEDYRKRPCPSCGKQGVFLDPSSQEFRCKYCKISGLRFKDEPTKVIDVQRQPNIPPVPPNVAPSTLVRDYYKDENGVLHEIAVFHAPKDYNVKEEEFDPNSFWAKVAITRFGGHAKRRQALNKRLIRRGREQNREIGPWTEQWTDEQKALSTFDIDGILRRASSATRRRQR